MAVMLGNELHCEMKEWDGSFDAGLRDAWEQLIAANSASFFHFPEWMEFACEEGVISPIQLLTVMRNSRILALIPLQKRTPFTWELPVPISAEYPPLLIDPEYEETVWIAIARWLRSQQKIGNINLGACGDRERIEKFEQACISNGLSPRLTRAATIVQIPLTDNWETFLGGLGKSTRNKLRRADTHLQNTGEGLGIDFLTEPAKCDEALDELIRLYQARWKDQIGGSVFSRSTNRKFYHHFVSQAMQQGHAVIPVMRMKDRTLAIGSVFHVPGQDFAHFHFIARDAEALPNHWLNSPGIILVGRVIRWAIAQGVNTLWMGAGSNRYKLSLGGTENQLWELSVARSPMANVLIPKFDAGFHFLRRLPIHLFHHVNRLVKRKQKSGAVFDN